MVLIGSGIGLTSAPATESIMGAVPRAKAGVGSAINDATRILGATLGVAVIGSTYASIYRSRLDTALTAHLPAMADGPAHRSVGARSGPLAGSRPPATPASRTCYTTPPRPPSSMGWPRPASSPDASLSQAH
jgi:hypothetical protein